MNTERKLTLIYFVLGIVMGLMSTYFDTLISVIIGAGVYAISFFASSLFIGEKKKFSWYMLNTLLTYVLVWLVTWIFLFNM